MPSYSIKMYDPNGNAHYPHSLAKTTFRADGTTVEETLGGLEATNGWITYNSITGSAPKGLGLEAGADLEAVVTAMEPGSVLHSNMSSGGTTWPWIPEPYGMLRITKHTNTARIVLEYIGFSSSSWTGKKNYYYGIISADTLVWSGWERALNEKDLEESVTAVMPKPGTSTPKQAGAANAGAAAEYARADHVHPTDTTRAAASHSHAWGDVTGKPSTFAPATHSHAWADVTGKPSTFAPATHNHTWGDVTGKPSTFTPATHTHTKSQITDLVMTTGVITLQEGFTSVHAHLLKVRKDPFGIVTMQLAVKRSTSFAAGTQIGVLPAGFRPQQAAVSAPCVLINGSGWNPASIDINPSGALIIFSSVYGTETYCTASFAID